jgi:hypothetical protein
MAISLQKPVRIALPVPGFNDQAIFIFPPHGNPELQRAINELLDTRQIIEGRNIKNNFTPARVKFFDAMCQGVENLVDVNGSGQEEDLMTFEDWKLRISTNWKTTVVSQNFEETNTLSAEDAKN